jgi:3-deoxy-D-manno-octulosonic-acid transferase
MSWSPSWRSKIARWAYSLLLYCAAPLVLLRLFWLGSKHPGYRQRWWQRFGFVPPTAARPIWIHAVSVGEVRAATPLVKRLCQQDPGVPILITTMTPTGADAVRHGFGPEVIHLYLPYDLPDALARFLKRVEPRLLVLIETELWPNLVEACRRRSLPVVLANGRLSARSAAAYHPLGVLVGDMLRSITRIAAQSQADADRFIDLGAPSDRVFVTGSVKFDVDLPADTVTRGEATRSVLGPSRSVLIAASTHAGEEELVLDAFHQVLGRVRDALLILVPRHPDRAQRLAPLCVQRGFEVVKRTDNPVSVEGVDVYLVDTLGELPMFYAASDVAFVGGSLVPVGGHNPLEASALGLPVLMGPQVFNFTAIDQLLREAGAARRVENGAELAVVATEMLLDPELRVRMGEAGRAVVDANRGAANQLMSLLTTVMSQA